MCNIFTEYLENKLFKTNQRLITKIFIFDKDRRYYVKNDDGLSIEIHHCPFCGDKLVSDLENMDDIPIMIREDFLFLGPDNVNNPKLGVKIHEV